MNKLDTIKSRIEKLGYIIEREQWASTGTIYLYIERGDYEVIVRIADHTEMYPPALNCRQISISPAELTISKAIKLLADPESITPYTLSADEIAEKKAHELRWADSLKIKADKYNKIENTLSIKDFDRAKKHTNMNVCREIAARYPGMKAGLIKGAALASK